MSFDLKIENGTPKQKTDEAKLKARKAEDTRRLI
jgi:hypothetical protein